MFFLLTPRRSFHGFCEQRRFRALERILRCQKPTIQTWLTSPATDEDYVLCLFRGETPLHILMQHRPTRSVVEALLPRLAPDATCAVDMHGRNPLHVACMHDCDVTVVQLLLEGQHAVMPAVAKDVWGRHALHWAASGGSMQVVHCLVHAYPEAVRIADTQGLTPLDLARSHHGTGDTVVRYLSAAEHKLFQVVDPKNSLWTESASTTEVSVSEGALELFSDVVIHEYVDNMNGDDISSVASLGASMHKRKQQQTLVTRRTQRIKKQPRSFQYQSLGASVEL